MPRFNIPTSARPMPWDRSPVNSGSVTSFRVSEDTAAIVRFTYTVPADTKAFLNALLLSMLVEIAATTSTTTDQINNVFAIQPSGGAFVDAFKNRMHSDSMVANDRESVQLAPAIVLVAGDAIRVTDIFDGDAAGAGRVIMEATLNRTEFNA